MTQGSGGWCSTTMVVVRRSWFVVVRPPIFQKSNEEEEVYEAKEFPQRHDRAMTKWRASKQ